MTGDLVLIVLKIKLIVIGQLERKEGQSQGKPAEDVRMQARGPGWCGEGPGWYGEALPHPTPPLQGKGSPLTSSPLGIRRLEMIIILSSLSNVTTSATQLGAQEWLMYLDGRTESVLEIPSDTHMATRDT